MTEVGVPPTSPPLEGTVVAEGGGPLAGAYVFYAPVGRSVEIETDIPPETLDPVKNWKGWDVVRTDEKGRYSLPIQRYTKYWVRPAMPGYSFHGKVAGDTEHVREGCPVEYTRYAGLTTVETLDLYIQPPKVATAVAVIGRISPTTLIGPHSLLAATSCVLPAETDLAKSHTKVSATLAYGLDRALMHIEADNNCWGFRAAGPACPRPQPSRSSFVGSWT
jgi:hypothetical protein